VTDSPEAIDIDRGSVTAAVRKLRVALGETQQQFAVRFDTAIRTIARYETVRPPRGRMLVEFHKLAISHGLRDVAGIFQHALSQEVGGSSQPLGHEETAWVSALLNIYRSRYVLQNQSVWFELADQILRTLSTVISRLQKDDRPLSEMSVPVAQWTLDDARRVHEHDQREERIDQLLKRIASKNEELVGILYTLWTEAKFFGPPYDAKRSAAYNVEQLIVECARSPQERDQESTTKLFLDVDEDLREIERIEQFWKDNRRKVMSMLNVSVVESARSKEAEINKPRPPVSAKSDKVRPIKNERHNNKTSPKKRRS
jgi:transcriptional regulator with XRE-family HTH domain